MSNKMLEKPAKKTASAPKLTKRIVLIIGVVLSVLLFVGTVVMVTRSGSYNFGTSQLQLETVSSPGAIEQGLSGRDSMADDQGMLFVFKEPGKRCFWMKDMKFSLDMIWLDSDKKVVTVKDNISPDTFPQSFCPKKHAQYVIEVNAGLAAQAGVKEGDQLNF